MVVFAVLFVLTTWGLWLLVRTVRAIASGEIESIGRGPSSYGFAGSPGLFVLTAFARLLMSVSLAGGGALVIALVDPAGLVLPPAAIAAAHGIALGLRAASGRSGDDGAGSVHALDRGDPGAVAARIDVLPDGAERRILRAVHASEWSPSVPVTGYREGADGGSRRARRDAVLAAAAAERRRLAPAGLLGAAGFLPYLALRLHSRATPWSDLSDLAAVMTATMALGAVVMTVLARRRVTALAARLAGAGRR